MLRPIKRKNKMGVSVMIGYILLISIAVAISVMIYHWIKTYVPKDLPDCPDGTSIAIKKSSCTISSDIILSVTLENNGRFNIAGYLIRATDSSEQELATIDLSSSFTSGGIKAENMILFENSNKNTVEPNEERVSIFTLDDQIYSIEITPIRFQEESSRTALMICGSAKTREVISCA